MGSTPAGLSLVGFGYTSKPRGQVAVAITGVAPFQAEQIVWSTATQDPGRMRVPSGLDEFVHWLCEQRLVTTAALEPAPMNGEHLLTLLLRPTPPSPTAKASTPTVVKLLQQLHDRAGAAPFDEVKLNEEIAQRLSAARTAGEEVDRLQISDEVLGKHLKAALSFLMPLL